MKEQLVEKTNLTESDMCGALLWRSSLKWANLKWDSELPKLPKKYQEKKKMLKFRYEYSLQIFSFLVEVLRNYDGWSITKEEVEFDSAKTLRDFLNALKSELY
jgi:hypothetical protein